MTGRILIFLLVITELQGQNLDSVVRDAVDAEFNRGGTISSRGITGGRVRPIGGRTSSQLIPTEVTGSTTDMLPGSGSGAINALNSFSQNNAPEMNRMLDDRSFRGSTAARNIASSPSLASRTNSTAAFRRVVSDQQIMNSFQRAMAPFCYEIPICDPQDPYRTADGSCNNLYDTLLGKSFTPQARIIQNAYDNFIDAPRTLTSDRQAFLPSARAVSNTLLSGSTPASSRFSTFLTHHGQFIDHDVISTPSMTEGNPARSITDCCSPSVRNKYACFTIRVPNNDPFFPPEQTCMNMVRHAAALPLGCTNGVREQQNQRSSFIDGTAIYGFNKERELLLRQRSGGRLKESSLVSGLLPRGTCPFGFNTPYHCFMAGDHRQSETPTLTVMHTTWLRRHNLIADALRTSSGITNDEVLFQEAKRIVVAELQHLTYTEFLQAVLDDFHMSVFNLYSRSVGHNNVYNPNVDPRTFNAFGAAVLRMGHTLVRNIVGHDNGRGNVQTFPLIDHFGNPNLMFSSSNGYEFMARWMSKNAKSRSDSAIVDGLRNRLFEGSPGPFPRETTSLDLGAMNTQRGREHGLPSYNAYRQFCGRYPANYFAAVRGGLEDHTPQAASRLASVYRSTHDIDLYAGGISETPIAGGILGPTFSCLFAYQFSLYKHGDRFWYENNNILAAFTPDQLAQIKQMTYSKVLCSVVKNDQGSISYQPRLLLRPEILGNYQRPCTQILNGNYLGFDIRPFANELSSLGGSRTGRSGPLHSFQGAFQRTSGGAARTSSLSDTSRKPTNSGFQVPNPADVLRNVTTNASGSQRGNSQPENTQTGRQGNNDRRQNQNRRGQNQNPRGQSQNRRGRNHNSRGQSQGRRGRNQNRRGQSQGRQGQSQGRRTKFQGRFGQTG